MEQALLTTLQEPPGVQVGDHLLELSHSCRVLQGPLQVPSHPPVHLVLWDSHRDVLSETPPGAAAFGPLNSWLLGLKREQGGLWLEYTTPGCQT